MLQNNELQALNEKGLFNGLDKVRFSDAQPTIAGLNTVMPAGVLASLSNQVIENILAKRTGDEALGGRQKMLDWGDEKYFLPFIEKAGQTSPYADNSTPLNASLNVSFNDCGHYRFSVGFVYGNLQAEQFSKAKINYVDVLMRSASEAIAVEFNRAAFEGYISNSGNSMLVYGLLNNPNLDNYIAETTKISAKTWQETMAFFAKAVSALLVKSGNVINGQEKIRCVISASVFAELQAKYTDLGISVYETLQKTYPKMTFVPAIELDGAENNENVVYFIGESDIGGISDTTKLGYSEIALMGNTVMQTNGYSQSMSAGTCGALIFKPSFVVRYSGI